MDFEAEARHDVEETLRAGRDSMERGIARGRLGLFGAVTGFMALLSALLLSGVVELGLPSGLWPRVSPVLMFGSGLVYAFVIWRRVVREGARPRFTAVVAFADVLVILATVLVLRHSMASPDGPAEPIPARFDIYGLAPILILVVYLGSMRVEPSQRLPLGLFAAASYLAVIRVDLGRFEVPQVLAATLIGVGAMLGARTSDHISELLDSHSRLSILRSYLPAAFVERVSRESVDVSSAIRPQSVEVTLLVSDLRGFTATSEKLTPAEVVQMLGEYHAAMVEAVEATGGIVDKFLGDGMLVVFGLASPGASAPPDAGAALAVQCAKAMLERLSQLNAKRAQEGRSPLAVGIGLHTGPVIAGTIGAGRRREFTVIGDAVNTASRLEGLTKAAGAAVLLSAATAARLDPKGQALRELEPMSVKGKSEPLRIFALDSGGEIPAAANS